MMSSHDRSANDAFDRYLDGLIGHRPVVEHGENVDAEMARAARSFHSLDAGDVAPEPRPFFLRRLEEDLMSQGQAVASTWRPTGPTTWTNRRGHQPARARRRIDPTRRRILPDLAIVAVLLLTLAIGYVAYNLMSPSPATDRSLLPRAAPVGSLAAEPTAMSAGQVVCEVDRPTPGALTETPIPPLAPGSGTPPHRMPSLVTEPDLPVGPPADAAAITGISNTIAQMIACKWTGKYLEFPTFFTDDYKRYLEPNDTSYLVLWDSIPALSDSRQLPDGRVGVYFEGRYSNSASFFYIFAERDGRWLVDELVEVVDCNLIAFEMPGCPSASPVR